MTEEPRPPDAVPRRAFLIRTAKAAAAAAGAGGLALWAHNRERTAPAPPPLPTDFRVAAPGPALAVVRNGDRAAMLDRALDALGGVGRFIAKGDRVLLKVNAAFATPARLGATSHPDLIQAVARRCFDAGAREVIVSDNPINDAQSCFSLTGIAAAAEAAGARVMLPRPGAFSTFTLPDGRLIRDWPVLAEPLRAVNKVIGLAPVKHHNRSGASMTLKNWYGLLGGRRNLFHQDIHGIISELSTLVLPTFVILDGTVTMMRNGPTGGSVSDLKETRTLICGTDPVAVDTVGAGLLDLRPADLPWLRMSAERTPYTDDVESLNPIRIDLS